MLDLTNFILNSSSFIEPSLNTQELPDSVQSTELSDDSADSDKMVDPSSFFMMFAEILAQTPDKNDTNANSTVSSSSTQGADLEITNTLALEDEALTNGQVMSSDIKKTDSIQTSADNQLITTELKTAVRQNILNNPNNNSTLENEALLPNLENNIAMAWINSENFHPPLSASSASELDQELIPELEALLAKPNELIEKALLKESLQQDYKEGDIAIPSIPVQEMDINRAMQEIKLESLPLENSQAIIQHQSLLNSGNQSLIETSSAKSLDISIDINNSQWADKFSEHIVWLGNQGIKSALIKIHPEDLGPLEISITVVKDSASVTINSHSSHVCAIVDQALPKLREMMAEQGLNLSEVHVGADDSSRQFSQNDNKSEDGIVVNTEDENLKMPAAKKAQAGLIDYFA